jgi:hypothetical protein
LLIHWVNMIRINDIQSLIKYIFHLKDYFKLLEYNKPYITIF